MPKVKIPKRVAGVKIPKKVRRKAKKALKMAEGPGLREAAALALGAATRAREAGREARRRANGHGPRTTRIDGDAIAEAIRDAAFDGVRRFLEGLEEGLRKAPTADEASRSDDPARTPAE